ncbi:hypothetical protein Tco_0399916, partial [Tanacetum coccineum]
KTLETYGDTVTFKIHQDDEDKDEEPSAGSNRGSKRRRAGKEPESTSAPKEKTSKLTDKSKEGSKSHHTSIGKSAQEEPIHADEDLEEAAHQEFDTGFTEDQYVDETTHHPDWFLKPSKPPTPDHNWNKTLPARHGLVQPWISTLARNEDPRKSFNELIDTPLDFSAFVMNRLKVDTLTPELLAGPTYKLMKDWNNPEGKQYPHDLRKPLPLIPNSRGHRVIPFDHFINNDLAYLSGGVSSRTYATSVTKTKAADYGYIKWIEDFIPNLMWSQVPIVYDKHALWGISYWGQKRQQFYGFVVNRESSCDVYSKHRILVVTKLKIVEWHNYKHLDWITVRRNDDKLYTFKEGDYNRLRLQDIEDMLLLLKVIEEPGKIRWWEIVRGRPSAAGKDHMIYHMMSLSKPERFYTSAGNPIKEILLKLNLPDHRILKDGGEVKEPQERCNIKAFQDNISRKVFKITFSHSSQDKGTSSSLKSMITTSNHKLMIEVKDYELKTKDKA